MNGPDLDDDEEAMRAYVSHLWSEEWDSPEDAAYDDYRWDDPGPDEMMPGCGHEIVDAAGTYDTGSGPAPGRGCER